MISEGKAGKCGCTDCACKKITDSAEYRPRDARCPDMQVCDYCQLGEGKPCWDTDTPTVLEEAARIVDGERNVAYGDPAGNHGTTAALWHAYLRRRGIVADYPVLDARDVCMLNVLQKVSRDAHWRQRDNLTDVAGYVRNAEIIGDATAI